MFASSHDIIIMLLNTHLHTYYTVCGMYEYEYEYIIKYHIRMLYSIITYLMLVFFFFFF